MRLSISLLLLDVASTPNLKPQILQMTPIAGVRVENVRAVHDLNMIRVCETTPRSGMASRRPFLQRSFPS